jgi:hypothetical protein
MSLDGFIAGPNDRVGQGLGEGGERLHEWVFELQPAKVIASPNVTHLRYRFVK